MESTKQKLLETLKELEKLQGHTLGRLMEQPSTASQYQAIDAARERLLLTRADILKLEIELGRNHG